VLLVFVKIKQAMHVSFLIVDGSKADLSMQGTFRREGHASGAF
jgi:hypothetical protein